MAAAAFTPLVVPHAFVASMIAAGVLCLVLPVLFAFWARRRFALRWAWVGFGALGFVLSQAVHVPLILLAKHFWLDGRTTALIIFASATAGLCEETARWFLLRRAVGDHSFRGGFGYGVGHGGVEAFLLAGVGGLIGVVQVLALAKLDPSTLPLTPDKLEAVRQAQAHIAQMVQGGWAVPFASVWERIWAVTLQLGLSLCVLRAVVRRKPGWLLLAMVLHAGVDVFGVLTMQWWGVLGAETFIGLVGVLALAFVVSEWRRWKQSEATAGPA